MKTLLKPSHSLIYILYIVSFFSCKEETIEYQANDCKKQPLFVKSIGFNPSLSAFSTSEGKIKGLCLIQFNKKGDTSNGGKKIYQHPSWKTAGSLGPIQLDPQGNCFVAPIAMVNLIDNPIVMQNTVYKVNSQTGEMKPFVNLPIIDSLAVTNPHGILGLAYLCESNTLYVSTVQGSTRQKENGLIYAIDAETGNIIDKMTNIDAIGIGISYIEGKRKLYFGSARTSDVYSINISKNGKFANNASLIFTISNLGPRGDDKARKIKFDKNGNMVITAIEFNFNLIAPTEKQETVYNFVWNAENQLWEHNN
ncbi:MAG: hypothetical protein ABL929_09045 [Ferruginibacter sp.]